jgi:hypothetical protein
MFSHFKTWFSTVAFSLVIGTSASAASSSQPTIVLSCIEETGDPFVHVEIEDRGSDGYVARVTENISDDGDQTLLGEVRVKPRVISETLTAWRSGNNRLTLEVHTAASGDMTATLTYRHREGRLFTDQLACVEE